MATSYHFSAMTRSNYSAMTAPTQSSATVPPNQPAMVHSRKFTVTTSSQLITNHPLRQLAHAPDPGTFRISNQDHLPPIHHHRRSSPRSQSPAQPKATPSTNQRAQHLPVPILQNRRPQKPLPPQHQPSAPNPPPAQTPPRPHLPLVPRSNRASPPRRNQTSSFGRPSSKTQTRTCAYAYYSRFRNFIPVPGSAA